VRKRGKEGSNDSPPGMVPFEFNRLRHTYIYIYIWSIHIVDLCSLSADATGELNVLGHDGHAFGVDRT